MRNQNIPDGFDDWLVTVLREGDPLPAPPEALEERLLELTAPAHQSRRHWHMGRAIGWAALAILLCALVVPGVNRNTSNHLMMSPVEAAIEKVQSAVVERETLDPAGRIVSRGISRYADHKWRTENPDEITIVTRVLFWKLDREEKRVVERRRAAAGGLYPDHFYLPELQRALSRPATTSRSRPGSSFMRVTIPDSDQGRLVLDIDAKSKLPAAWTAEVRVGDAWLPASRGRAEYNVAVDPDFFKPTVPAGYDEGLSLQAQQEVADRLREQVIRKRFGNYSVSLRDSFMNREGDLFFLVSLPEALLKQQYLTRLVSTGSFVQIPTSVLIETGDPAMGPEPLGLEGLHTAVLWWAAYPQNPISSSLEGSLRFEMLPGFETDDLISEKHAQFALNLNRSDELLPDWMEMASSPLSPARYRLDRGIALGDRLALSSPKEALKQYDSALAARLSRPLPDRALAWEGKAKVLRAMGRNQEALDCARRALEAAGNDEKAQRRLRQLFPDL